MKTVNDTLSFADLQTYDDTLIDSVAEAASMDGPRVASIINKERPELTARLIHTFLEWDTCLEFNCCFGDEFVQPSGSRWAVSYVSADHKINSLIVITEVDTFQEAKIIAEKKISHYLGRRIHFEQDGQVKDDLFMVIRDGKYYGMVEIRQVEKV